ncbi:P-loop containing nucleoside triphosphate hydrolase protein [Patellaria atrata CBS 101060]|uniref:Origin recognition complex subunit 1 n=1 Tax=Patellaria atrata CBS 101060 TaxID=1346257 RepID=A0A9P4VW86_9PEZI|nr:P-loop containing nucleoside triphosphate hydrolase protein [Patellaria atrata CBS 101060]
MAPSKDKVERAKRYLKTGGVFREDSDDELGIVDHPWQWIYTNDDKSSPHGTVKELTTRDVTPRKRRFSEATGSKNIIGARMGSFECKVGDTVLLKAEGQEAWVGIICDLFDDEEEDEKAAKFMWFSTHKEVRNKLKKRTDYLENELYISPSWDDNPLTTINGKATVLSPAAFAARYPNGKIPRNSRDHGKVFICKRGCNTRTATYTDEFVWENIYKGEQDIPSLIELVQGQTKATRKRSKADKAELDDFLEAENEDQEGIPSTPKKRRKASEAVTPKSRKGVTTPHKFLTPTHKRIVVKKALEFTPLGTRTLSPNALSSPFQVARSQLHVSSVPASLPCREEEFATVYSHLEAAITEGSGSCIYISGTPGTGKTATVREVVAQLNASVQAEELDDFIFVEINGMKITDPHQSYSLLWEALRGDRVSPSHALELLEREFSTPSPRRVPCVVLMDELDQLVTKNQSVMYNFFNWPGLRHSRLIVLAVANTMDLPERTLSNKISSRLGLTRITFPGYTHDQLISIIKSRLQNVPGNIVHPDAIQFASRKVAAVSGDARRALDICRRAVEIAEAEALAKERDTEAPDTPSKTGRGSKTGLKSKGDLARDKQGIVTIATIRQAINEATSSPLQQYLRALPLASKLFLAALLARIRRTGLGEALLGDVLDEGKQLGLMSQLTPIHDYLLGQDNQIQASTDGVDTVKGVSGALKRGARAAGKAEGKAARVQAMGVAAMELMEAGIIGMEARRGERVGRVRLGVGDEEVRLALRDDEEVRGLGFAA